MEYPGDADGVEFLFIARVIREKGIEEYLWAAKQTKKRRPDAVFHVLGPCDGDYQGILEEYGKKGSIAPSIRLIIRRGCRTSFWRARPADAPSLRQIGAGAGRQWRTA